MLSRIIVGVLVIMMMLAAGCGRSSESPKEMDGIARDRVLVTFTVPYRDVHVSDLLESLGSHVIETVYYSSRMQASVPESMTAAEMIEALEASDLVEDAEPYYLYAPDEVTVRFNVAPRDATVTALLESLGSQIKRTHEYSDFVLVSVPEDKTVANMVEALSASPLVDHAEPNYYAHICLAS